MDVFKYKTTIFVYYVRPRSSDAIPLLVVQAVAVGQVKRSSSLTAEGLENNSLCTMIIA